MLIIDYSINVTVITSIYYLCPSCVIIGVFCFVGSHRGSLQLLLPHLWLSHAYFTSA